MGKSGQNSMRQHYINRTEIQKEEKKIRDREYYIRTRKSEKYYKPRH